MIAAPTITSPFAATGEHWLLDCHGVAPSLLTASATLEALLVEAAVAAGARVLFSHFHRFDHDADPDHRDAGVTGVVLLAESHLTIHTWPEHGFAAIDLFLCGATKPERAVACLARGLGDPTIVERRQRRGMTDASPSPASRDR